MAQMKKPVVKATKAPVKKKVLVMPNKISPSKMTPAQKARYLQNPERYDGLGKLIMVAPLVGLAVGAVARAAAKKAATSAVKKVATKAVPRTVKRAALVSKNKKSAKNNMKIVNKVADLQQKTKAETIAKNSVKTKSATDAATRAAKNSAEKARVDTAKSGAAARYYAGQVESKRRLPAKVVQINSKKK